MCWDISDRLAYSRDAGHRPAHRRAQMDLGNEGDTYSLSFRSLACESAKKDFESAIGPGWISRDDAVRAFAGCLGLPASAK